jgi:transcriptional regulator with GAF, ATPase, and Fis domain
MDMRAVASKVLIYIIDVIYMYAFFYLLVWIFETLYGSVFTFAAFLSGAILIPLFLASLFAVDGGIKNIIDRFFFLSLFNPQKTITKLAQNLSRYLDLETITTLLVNTIKDALQLDRAGLLLLNSEVKPAKYEVTRMVGFDAKMSVSLAEDTFLTRYLNKNQKVLSQEEINVLYKEAKDEKEKESIGQLRQQMKDLDASVCLPIFSRNRILGIVILGPKDSKDTYTQEDFDLLNTLAVQAGMAIENAKLYSRLQKINKASSLPNPQIL